MEQQFAVHRGAGLGFHGMGRLKPDSSLGQARADFAGVTKNLAIAYPEVNKGIGAALIPFKQRLLGDVQPILLVLFCSRQSFFSSFPGRTPVIRLHSQEEFVRPLGTWRLEKGLVSNRLRRG